MNFHFLLPVYKSQLFPLKRSIYYNFSWKNLGTWKLVFEPKMSFSLKRFKYELPILFLFRIYLLNPTTTFSTWIRLAKFDLTLIAASTFSPSWVEFCWEETLRRIWFSQTSSTVWSSNSKTSRVSHVNLFIFLLIKRPLLTLSKVANWLLMVLMSFQEKHSKR